MHANALTASQTDSFAARRLEYARQEVTRTAYAARIEAVHVQTAVRIAENVLEHDGSLHAAIAAAKRYIAARVVASELSQHDLPKDKPFEPSAWVGAVVFGAAVVVIAYEAACVMGLLP
jgi:hypothetical protein